MKTKSISFGLLLLIISCNTAQKDDNTTSELDQTSETDQKSEMGSESSVVYDPSEAIWGFEYDPDTEDVELKQLRPVDKNALTGESIEKIVNKSWPRIELKFIKISNDTAFVSIPNSQVLTQQMGSSGAMSYLVSTTYSFTELAGINHVSFDFEEGDHAVPGVYNRNSWDKNNN